MSDKLLQTQSHIRIHIICIRHSVNVTVICCSSLYTQHLLHVCPSLLCGSSWGFFHCFFFFYPVKRVFFFPINPQIEGLRTEDVVHCTDCKAHWGNVIVILGYIKTIWFDLNTHNDNLYIILLSFNIHFLNVSTFIPFLCMFKKCWTKVTAVDISLMGKNKKKARRKERGKESCNKKWMELCQCGDVEQRDTADCKKERSAKTTTHTYNCLDKTILVLILILETQLLLDYRTSTSIKWSGSPAGCKWWSRTGSLWKLLCLFHFVKG